MARISLKVNGKSHVVDVDPTTAALRVPNDLELNGPRFGCGLSQCGACTVVMSGKAIRSCTFPVSAVKNQEITTLEGLEASPIRIRCSKLLSTNKRLSAGTA